MKVEITMGSYPRADVVRFWVKDGRVREGTATVSVREADGSLRRVGEFTMVDLGVVQPTVEVGAEIVVNLRGRFDDRAYEREVTFTATGDEDDVYVSAIGPGARAEPPTGRLFKRTHYSGFEFGVLAMAATTEQGTRVPPRSGALFPHGPGDGVG